MCVPLVCVLLGSFFSKPIGRKQGTERRTTGRKQDTAPGGEPGIRKRTKRIGKAEMLPAAFRQDITRRSLWPAGVAPTQGPRNRPRLAQTGHSPPLFWERVFQERVSETESDQGPSILARKAQQRGLQH
jgi:hypothetical protein